MSEIKSEIPPTVKLNKEEKENRNIDELFHFYTESHKHGLTDF